MCAPLDPLALFYFSVAGNRTRRCDGAIQYYSLADISSCRHLQCYEYFSLLKTEYIPFKSTLCLVQIFFFPFMYLLFWTFLLDHLLSSFLRLQNIHSPDDSSATPLSPFLSLSRYLITQHTNLGFTSRYPDKSHLIFRFTALTITHHAESWEPHAILYHHSFLHQLDFCCNVRFRSTRCNSLQLLMSVILRFWTLPDLSILPFSQKKSPIRSFTLSLSLSHL